MPTVSGLVYDDTGAPAVGRTVRFYRRDTGVLLGETITGAGVSGVDWPSAGFGTDTHAADVLLLLAGNGTNGSTTITDSSTHGYTATNVGGVAVNTTTKKFGSGSLQFGTGKQINYTHTQTTLSDVWTLEMWVYPTTLPAVWGIAQKMYYSVVSAGTMTDCKFALRGVVDHLVVYYSGTNNSNIKAIDIPGVFTAGVWTHIAVVRNGTSAEVFINGVSGGTTTGIPTGVSSAEALYIGRFYYFDGANQYNYLDGFIDDFRLTEGVARYTSGAGGGIGALDPDFTKVSLLMHGETATDDSHWNQQADPLNVRYLAGVYGNAYDLSWFTPPMAFAPVGAECAFDGHEANALSTEDWTFEMLIRPIGATSYDNPGYILSVWNSVITYSGVEGYPWTISLDNVVGLMFRWGGGTTGVDEYRISTTAGAPPPSAVSHIAIVRRSNVIHFFLNGVEKQCVKTQTVSGVTTTSGAALGQAFSRGMYQDANKPWLLIGGYSNGLGMHYEEMRLTKGLARYTADFTPTTSPHPDLHSVSGLAGSYSQLLTYTGEVQVVCLDDPAGTVHNDLIHRTTPI